MNTNSSNPSSPGQNTGSGTNPPDSVQGKSSATGALRDTAQAVKRDLQQATSDMRQAGSDAVGSVKQRAARLAADEKGQAAGMVDRYGNAIRESARSFEGQDPNIAHFASQAADKLQHVAEYIRSSSYHDLREDTENFGRRHPAAFFGGLFVVGLIAGNILKASRPRGSQDEGYEDHEAYGDVPYTGSMVH